MKTKKTAKKAAALEACIKLHQIGELNDSLLPVKRNDLDSSTLYLFANWPKEIEKNAGNTKLKQLYNRLVIKLIK